ncbi:MAG: iron-sulfur cluster assembly scaffold protein [Planctomycetota bacterium]|nr:iron-sulfur cluster assembly scaffold protein [Planctomycetota bacterium]
MAQNQPYSAKVAEHLQSPRHLGLLSAAGVNPATEKLVVADAGPSPRGNSLSLSLKLSLSDERILDAGFAYKGSRMPVAGASCLCSMIVGKTLAEAAAITGRDLDRELDGLPEIIFKQPVLALNALDAATRAARGLPPRVRAAVGEPLLCKCNQVPESVIERAVRLRGLRTADDVTDATRAGGGCGSCRDDIEALIARCQRGEYKVHISQAEYEEAHQLYGAPLPSAEELARNPKPEDAP